MNTLLKAIEVLGMLAFALTGVAAARRKGMDIVGVYFTALVTALGGGTVRDVLLDRRPLFWVQHWEYPAAMLGLALIAVVMPRKALNSRWADGAVVTLDALGLGLFAASGASLARDLAYPLFIDLLMGVITGIFGGVLRDMICNEIPLVFTQTELYATCAAAGVSVFLLLGLVGVPYVVCLSACIAITAGLRLASVRYHIKLPF